MELSECLFVPAIGEANIYGNISQCFVVREHQIIRVGDRRKLRIKLGQFDIDPVIGSLICIFNAVVKCLAGCRAAFQVRETGLEGAFGCFAENSRINKFNNVKVKPLFCLFCMLSVICPFRQRSSIFQTCLDVCIIMKFSLQMCKRSLILADLIQNVFLLVIQQA